MTCAKLELPRPSSGPEHEDFRKLRRDYDKIQGKEYFGKREDKRVDPNFALHLVFPRCVYIGICVCCHLTLFLVDW